LNDTTYDQHPGAAAFADGACGAPEDAELSLFDRGFTRSDAIYDVASAGQGAFFRLEDHLDRFFASLGKLRLQVHAHRGPRDPARLRARRRSALGGLEQAMKVLAK